MEFWDIYNEKKEKTGRTMKRNDWNMKPDEFHLTVLGVLQRPDGRYLITRRRMDKEWAAGWWEVPGGGVKNGAKAQEESLCRCSNLYPCLSSPRVQEKFYKYHYLKKRFFYSDRVIYTKDVTVFKDDELDLLDKEKWFHVDILTCAAPFTAKIGYVKEIYSVFEKFKLSRTALMRIFESRIKNIIN